MTTQCVGWHTYCLVVLIRCLHCSPRKDSHVNCDRLYLDECPGSDQDNNLIQVLHPPQLNSCRDADVVSQQQTPPTEVILFLYVVLAFVVFLIFFFFFLFHIAFSITHLSFLLLKYGRRKSFYTWRSVPAFPQLWFRSFKERFCWSKIVFFQLPPWTDGLLKSFKNAFSPLHGFFSSGLACGASLLTPLDFYWYLCAELAGRGGGGGR